MYLMRPRPVGAQNSERWLSGRKRSPAKGVRVKSPSRVRIPLSPPASLLLRRSLEETVMSLAKAPFYRGFVLSGLVKAAQETRGQEQTGLGLCFVSAGHLGEWVLPFSGATFMSAIGQKRTFIGHKKTGTTPDFILQQIWLQTILTSIAGAVRFVA